MALTFALHDLQDPSSSLSKGALKILEKGMFRFIIKITHKMLYHILTLKKRKIQIPDFDPCLLSELYDAFDDKFIHHAVSYDAKNNINFCECLYFPPY